MKIKKTGFTIIELVVGLLIILVGFIAWLGLASTTINTAKFSQKFSDVRNSAKFKAEALLPKANDMLKSLPPGQTQIGSIAPDSPAIGYYDELNFNGWVIGHDQNQTYLIDQAGNVHTNPPKVELIPKFTRQWLIVKDIPNKDEITIYVTVLHRETNQIIRTYKDVLIDGLSY